MRTLKPRLVVPLSQVLRRSKEQGFLGFAPSWVSSETLTRNILWHSVLLIDVGWKDTGKLHEGLTLVSFPLVSLNPATNLDTSLDPRKICLIRIWVFLLLISRFIFVSRGTSSNKQQWFVKWIHSYNHYLNLNRDGICPSPQKSSLFPSAAKLQPPPRPGNYQYNFDIFFFPPTLLSPFLVIVAFSPCRNAGNCKSHTFLDHHLISLFFSSVLIWQNKNVCNLRSVPFTDLWNRKIYLYNSEMICLTGDIRERIMQRKCWE